MAGAEASPHADRAAGAALNRPHAIVLAERGAPRVRFTRSWPETFLYGFLLGLRTWIDRKPARVVTVTLRPGHPVTDAWLARFREGDHEAARAGLLADMDAMRAAGPA